MPLRLEAGAHYPSEGRISNLKAAKESTTVESRECSKRRSLRSLDLRVCTGDRETLRGFDDLIRGNAMMLRRGSVLRRLLVAVPTLTA
jgi:hypothetical protein